MKEQITALIANGKVQEALKALLAMSHELSTKKCRKITLLSCHYHRLQKDWDAGIISYKEYREEALLIASHLLKLSDKLLLLLWLILIILFYYHCVSAIH